MVASLMHSFLLEIFRMHLILPRLYFQSHGMCGATPYFLHIVYDELTKIQVVATCIARCWRKSARNK